MDEAAYWEQRRVKLFAQMEKNEAKLLEQMGRRYDAEIAKLEKDIAAYYQEYGENNVIEYRKLLNRLSDADRRLLMERMDEFAKKYPEYAHLLPVRESIYKLNELEGIQTAMRMQQLEIGAIEQKQLDAHLKEMARRAANLAAEQMGFGRQFYGVNADVVRLTVGSRWADDKSFSERIWDNRAKLAAYLNDDFSKGIARGLSYDKMRKLLMERFANVSKRDAQRLVYTEGTFVLNEAQRQAHMSFQPPGTMYSLSTVTDPKVCDVCAEVERNTEEHPVRLEDAEPGANFPPMHPNCRCSYVIALEDEDEWIAGIVGENGDGDAARRIAAMGLDDKPIDWPAKGEEISRAEYRELRKYANERGVKLSGFRRSDVDIDAAKMALDAIGEVTKAFPELSNVHRKGIQLNLVEGMDSRVFARSRSSLGHVIDLNAAAFRDLARLESEYGKFATDGTFVRGTTAKSILFHEMGHMYAAVNKVSGMRIARGIIGSKDPKVVTEYLVGNLSEYSAVYENGQEIVSEVFSAWFGGVNNSFANTVMAELRKLRNA